MADNIGRGKIVFLFRTLMSLFEHQTRHRVVSSPFKISSQDLTGGHYCLALLDGSTDEYAIAVYNRHEKVTKTEARDI